MFWSSPSADMQVIIFLLAVSLVIGVAVYFFSKKLLWSVFTISVLSNVILYGNLTHRNATAYDVLWLFYFVRDIFPYINIAFLILIVVIIFRKKYAK